MDSAPTPTSTNGPAVDAGPLAIIGVGCHFPGSTELSGFWARVVNGADSIREVPPSHWNSADYLDTDPKAPDRIYAARGGFLDPVPFNPAAFGIAPNNLEATDSSQLLGLLVAQQALADCGYAVGGNGPRSVDRSRVSVILGVTGTLQLVIPLGARLGHPIWRRALKEAGVEDRVADDVVQRIAEGYVPWQENSFPGLLGNVVAGRIANRFDLGGTNCVVDAACASSLSAIHLAAMELHTGRADLVLTGGVDTFNDVFMFTCFSKTPALSPTGDARPFDAGADGTVLGEGLGMVVLKRLADARRDGDRIYAVLRGIGSSSDGKGNAIYAPRKEGQIDAVRTAYRVSGVTPDTIELVEAHGTGTKVGDATEATALAEVYRDSGRRGRWCALGSIKSQLGHTKAAAGVAGLLKAACALHHKVLPPTIKVRSPQELFLDADCPLYVNAEKRPWMPSPGHPRRAAVSAFGFGGSNFHCVLEEAEPAPTQIDWSGEVQLLAFHAVDAADLARQVQAWPADLPWPQLRRRAAATRRDFRPDAACRLIVVVEREADLAQRLRVAADGAARQVSLPAMGVFFGAGAPSGRLAVLFPGQGAQYPGMLRDLVCHFPAAFATFAAAEAGQRLVDLVYPPAAFRPEDRAAQEQALRATDVAQPALGAVSLAAWRVLEALGVRADAFAGHSYGELTALCAAGRLIEADFHSLSRLRGRLMAEAGRGPDAGAMLAVKAPLPQIERVLRSEGIELTLANKNAPEQTVLSGPTAEIERAARAFAAAKVGATRLGVAAAFHSPLVAAARQPFLAALGSVAFSPGAAVYANSTAGVYPADAGAARELLGNQLARPVEWVRLLEALHADGVRDLLEVGPGARLSGLVAATLGERAAVHALDGSTGQRGWSDLAACVAWLAARGQPVRLAAWDPADAAEPAAAKTALTVELCGANYVRPRPPRRETVVEHTPASNGTPVAKMSQPASSTPRPTPTADGTALAQALQMTRESLAALQKMQEQTSQLHRQFLDGQEQAHRTVAMLVEQQQRLLQASLGQPVALPPVAPPPPAAKPVLALPPVVQAPPPPPPPPPTPAPVATGRVEGVLLEVIAEKTGYPAEMLELGMALDADLGIDSIKRVEILSALQERLPEAPAVKPEHLGSLHTLADIAAFLAGVGDAPLALRASLPTPGAGGAQRVQQTLLEVIAEKTGYPAEMLELGMALDADLGIDSIKRVEILSALQERLPEAPPVKPEHLGTLHTLADIAAFLAGTGASPPPVGQAFQPDAAVGQAFQPDAAVGQAFQPDTHQKSQAGKPDLQAPLQRGVVQVVPLAGEREAIRPAVGAEVWVADDEPQLANAVAKRLAGLGLWPHRGRCAELAQQAAPAALAGLVVPAPVDPTDDWLRDALFSLQQAGSALRAAGGVFVTVSRLDGAFGLGPGDLSREPLDGGLAGLAKTAAQEWKEIHAKAIDLDDSLGAEAAADAIVEEMFLAGPAEVGVSAAGKVTLRTVTQPLPTGDHPPFRPGELVVVSGGARGVTAEVAVELARQFRPTLLLLGRSPLPGALPDGLEDLADEPAVRREIARRNPAVAPRAVAEQAREVLAAREVRRTLDRLRQAGAEVDYRTVDVREPAAVSAVVSEARQRYGPVRGVVHGAGVLADARIEDKTPAQFDAVYRTKVAGLRALLAAVGADELRALVLFSSSTARFGRAGQVDYAIANEVLNKVAGREAARRPGCRVVALNWGPWDGGMVTPALKELFCREGIGVIPLEAGARLLADELRVGPGGPTEVVVLAAEHAEGPHLPAALPVAFERVVSVADSPVLADHVLDGRPVLPVVLILEWLAHAALVQNAGLAFHGCDDLRVLHGVTLEGGQAVTLRVGAGKAARRDGLFVAAAELRSRRPDGREVLHARAEVVLADALPAAPPPRAVPPLPPYPLTAEQAYKRGMLFHGPRLHGIADVEGCSESAIAGTLRAAPPPASWLRQPLRQHWLADPLVLDSAFQLLILWSVEHRGAVNLPCHIRRYRQYRRGYPAEGARAAVWVERASDLHALADIELTDGRGVIARLEGYECVIDASLERAFRRNVAVTA